MGPISKDIEDDNVNLAFEKLKEEIEKKKSSLINTYYALNALSKLVMASIKNKKPCNSSSQDIFNLAELCCSDQSIWKHDQKGCMTCMYFMVRYLLEQREPILARELCGYIFLYCTKAKNNKWEEKEASVLEKMIGYFTYHFSNVEYNLIKDSNSVTYPLLPWFKFVLKLNEFNDFTCTDAYFRLCYTLIRASQLSGNHPVQFSAIKDLVEEFSEHIEKLLKKKRNLNLAGESIFFSSKILSEVVCFFEKDRSSFLLSAYPFLNKFIQCLKSLISSYGSNNVSTDDIEVLELLLLMFFSKNEDDFAQDFESFFKKIQSKQNFSVDIYPLTIHCLSLLRSKILKPLSIENGRVVIMVNIILRMITETKSKIIIKSTLGTTLMHAFTTAMYFVDTSQLDLDSMIGLFKTVKLYFNEFNYVVTSIPKGQTFFKCGFPYCVNVLLSYKVVELYKEMATLSKCLLKYTLLLNDEILLSFDKFELILDTFFHFLTTSYGKIGLSADAQVALLAFAGVHPTYTDLVFKYWAELKEKFTDVNDKKGSTCYHVITNYKKEIEDKWSPCSVESIDIERCLLAEIKAYAKHRELQIYPVIEVYRVSVKLLKDKLVLSRVLTAAVDCISSDTYDTNLTNLHLSLENVYGSLTRLKENVTDERKLCQINCALGDIVYQQVRCDIAQIRKKAVDEFELLKVPAIEDIPIIEGGGNNVTPAFAYLKQEVQSSITQKMLKALTLWSDAANYVKSEDKEYFSFRFMKGLAYLFRLYDNKAQEIETWKIIYSLSSTFSNGKYKVLAVAQLLGLACTVEQSWIADAKETFQKEDSIKKLYVYTLFLINQAKNCYLNRRYDEATKLLNDLNDELRKSSSLLGAQYNFLHFQLKNLTVESSPGKIKTTFLALNRSFEYIIYAVKKKTWRTFSEKCVVQWLLLEISLVLAKSYMDLRMVRHARLFAKKQLEAAQLLALPIRVCDFLTVLCGIDLLTGTSVEANEKLNGLDGILELHHISVLDNNNDPDAIFFKTSSIADVSRPEFLSHEESCSCHICGNMDLLAIMVDLFTLKTIYTSSAGAQDLAKHVSKIGKEIIDFIDKKRDTIPQDWFTGYDESVVRFYLHLSRAHAAWGEMNKAFTYSTITMETLKSEVGTNWLLMREISSHWITLNWSLYQPPPIKKYKPKLFKEDSLDVENVKTPEPVKPLSVFGKRLRKAISPSSAVLPITPCVNNARKIIFDDPGTVIDVEGMFKMSDKENIGSPEGNVSSKNSSARSPLAHFLPLSPKSGFSKNLSVDEFKSTSLATPKNQVEQVQQTPKPTRRALKGNAPLVKTVRAQTVNKRAKQLHENLFSTPYTTRKIPEIKIFCDDDSDVQKSISTRKKKGTAKKVVPKTEKKTIPKVVSTRKLTFDSDSDDEKKVLNKPQSTNGICPINRRRLFDEKEDGRDSASSVGSKNRTSLQSDESGIIDATIVDQTENWFGGPVTPLGVLEDSLKKLTLSGRKQVSLSTRKMAKSQNSEQTPTSSQLPTKSRSRLTGRSARE